MKMLNEERLRKNIESSVYADLESGRVGGVAMVVQQQGKLVYQGLFGKHVANNTLFRLASMTKPVTAVAVLLLIDRGQVGLYDPVSRYLPSFGVRETARVDTKGNLRILAPGKAEMTIFHLLTHSSGLGSRVLGEWQQAHRPTGSMVSLQAAVEYYSTLSLAFEPGTAPDYSPIFAFDVLARLVEVVAGQPYDRFLEREIFRPLGMRDTTFAPSPAQWQRMIPMHDYADGQGRSVPMPENCIFENFPTTYFAGGAGLASTLDDYGKFAQMLLSQGGGLLSPGIVRTMGMPQYNMWGLGVRAAGNDEIFAPLPAGCFGWSGAYGTHFWVDPVNEITAVYMKNSRYDGGAGARTACQFEGDVYGALEEV